MTITDKRGRTPDHEDFDDGELPDEHYCPKCGATLFLGDVNDPPETPGLCGTCVGEFGFSGMGWTDPKWRQLFYARVAGEIGLIVRKSTRVITGDSVLVDYNQIDAWLKPLQKKVPFTVTLDFALDHRSLRYAIKTEHPEFYAYLVSIGHAVSAV